MLSLSEIEYSNDCLSMYVEPNQNSHNSVDEATFLLTFHCPVAVVKKCILFKERKEKVSFKEKLSCSSGFTRRREQIRPKSPLSNQGFNLFQSPQISTPCQLKHRLSLVAFEKYNSRATITIWYLWFCTFWLQDLIFLLFLSHFDLFHEDK